MNDAKPLRKSDLTKRLLKDLIERRDFRRLTEYISLAREIEVRLALSGRNKRCPMDWVDENFLRLAFEKKHEALICFIEAGANINLINANNESPLLEAAERGHIDVVNALIKAGADVNNESDDDERTPLLHAVMEGHVDVVNVLIKAGADVNKANGIGRTALSYAVWSGNIDVVSALIEGGADVNFREVDGRTEVVKLLKAAGAKE